MYIFSGTTNRKELIDEALLRPGRLEVHVEIGLPDKRGRFDILNIHTAEIKTTKLRLDSDINLNKLVDDMDGMSGADINDVVEGAKNIALYGNKVSVI